MAIIEKKVLSEYFDFILSGKKKYELRLGDFDIAEGDELVLKEWTGTEYTGRELRKKVTLVRKWKIEDLFWSREEIEKHGLQIISF